MATDNHPIIEHMSILDWKWDTTTNPLTKLPLVHWFGLPSEDTTSEHWEDLWASHNLLDKVNFPEKGDDSNIATYTRPKRTQKKRPNYLIDFV